MAHRTLLYFALSLITLTSTLAYPANVGPHEAKRYPTENPEVESLSPDQAGYPELLTRKTSRLLSEALHMLNRVKDVHERRWLESFVHRLATLANELDQASEPNNKANKTTKDLVEFSKSLVENADQLKDFVSRAEMGSLPKSFPEQRPTSQKEDDLVGQLKSQKQEERKDIQDKLITNKTPKTSVEEEHEVKMEAHRANKLKLEKLKEAEKKKILKEIFALSQKLRELGGETKVAMEVIKRSRGRIQIGTGHHFWDGAHQSSTLNPAGGQLRAAGGQVARPTTSAMTPSEIHSDSESDDEASEEDLVKQLEEEKFIIVTDPNKGQN